MKYKLIILLIALITTCIKIGVKLYSYYAPAQLRPPYRTAQHHNDTIRIAYIGDSWAFGHQFHQCKIKEYLEKYSGLLRVEVTFNSEEEEKTYIKEDWMGAEITDSPLAFDKYLCKLSEKEFKAELDKYLN